LNEAKQNAYKIRSLQSFSFKLIGIEKGVGVREKAKNVCELLDHPETVEEERAKVKEIRSKLSGFSIGSM